tara:strand:+ start:28720 stop:28986 length:267 start_codon:yes stop_codon:yes gene_type:complete
MPGTFLAAATSILMHFFYDFAVGHSVNDRRSKAMPLKRISNYCLLERGLRNERYFYAALISAVIKKIFSLFVFTKKLGNPIGGGAFLN